MTAVVLTYDGRELLDVILPSVAAQDYPNLRTVVVDNGSSDGSAGYVRERWPQFEVLRIERNVGVAAALNRGLEAARDPFVALLNNDLELAPDWVRVLVDELEAHPGAASATGKTLNYWRRRELDAAGDEFMWSGVATHRGFGQPDDGRYDQADWVFSPCAGVALYRRSAFDSVGVFDEGFFAYLEDIDWGLRAQLTGLGARYQPAALAYHMGGATTGKAGGRYGKLLRRNQLWLIAKDYPARALVRHAPKILSYRAARVVEAARDGTLKLELGATADAVRGLGPVLRKRRSVQRSRSVSLDALDAAVSAEPYAGEGIRARAGRVTRELLAR